MLNFVSRNNMWNPPHLPLDVISENCRKSNLSNYRGRDFLLIFNVYPYIDSILLHVSDSKDEEPELIGRFVFAEEYVWSYEEEALFVERCLENKSCGYSYAMIDEIYEMYSSRYPDWKLSRHYTNPFRLLDHIYHCMRKNSAKEILYTAGLDELAIHIKSIDRLNLLSTKPSDIYDGLSMKILRALNCREGAALLSQASFRNFLRKLQSKFPEIFTDRLNDAQCAYLNYLITGELTVGEAGRLFMARKSFLLTVWNEEQYKLFLLKEKSYVSKKQIVEGLSKIDPIYGKNLKVDKNNADNTDYRIPRLKECLLINREEYNRKIRCSNRKRNPDWQERGKGYVVRYPQTANDFCREAVYMNNCLLTYIDAVISGDTTVLFMRKEYDVNTPFITIEICRGELMQAYHRFNEDCTPGEAEWIRGYCDRHGIDRRRYQFDRDEDELF